MPIYSCGNQALLGFGEHGSCRYEV